MVLNTSGKTSEGTPMIYSFSICNNKLKCNGKDIMTTERFSSNPDQLCIDLASYNASIQPIYSSIYNDADSWRFEYDTGECNHGICNTWLPVFVCDKNVKPYSIGPVTQEALDSVVYEVVINTTYACHQ